MISGHDFADGLGRHGFDFFTGVPCSLIEDLIAVLERGARAPYVAAVREDAAVGVAAGAWFGGRRPVVLMQNSGLGTSLNALASLSLMYGLPVLLVRMNPDLSMGDGLLKKTGAGNLFTVFGEPDVHIEDTPDGLVVELHGVDVFDPTTGEVRSSDPSEIAMWMIDTAYNEESFFVRDCYFTGGGVDPYTRLKKALRAEIDEEAWASLYSTRSRPFQRPRTGRIAVKVINHYGDEVLKVYEV